MPPFDRPNTRFSKKGNCIFESEISEFGGVKKSSKMTLLGFCYFLCE